MSNQNKVSKNLVKALAALLTMISLVGITAAPAMAESYEDKPIEVNVTERDGEGPPPIECESTEPARWVPATGVTYPNDNNVDFNDLTETGQVDVSLGLYFEKGCEYGSYIDPTGTVTAAFSDLIDLSVVSLDCSEPGCDPNDLLDPDSALLGLLDVNDDALTGTATATLRVNWVPAN